MAKYIELIDKYRIIGCEGYGSDYRPPSYQWVDNTGEIVWCRECKHHEYEEPGMVYCPKIVGSWVSENWFCADGEREVQE